MIELYSNTIFALASGTGRAGVAIIRVSGEGAGSCLIALSGRKLPTPRQAVVRKLQDKNGAKLDEALVLYFEGPASFTGEDMVEFHVHGGRAVIDGLYQSLFDLGLRQAEAGEFTKRAFQNGRLDLTEAEGLADLIDAQTHHQRTQALQQMQGGLRDRYENWREQIIAALALIEGELDFADEGDVPDDLAHASLDGLQALEAELITAIGQSTSAQRVRDGIDIAILGAPNAGKSSLMNQLAQKDMAIISAQAGTTRDIVSAHMVMAGLDVRLSDTAGLRQTDDEIEAEGVKRAKALAQNADIRILVVDASNDIGAGLSTERLGVDLDLVMKQGDFVILNKIDQISDEKPVVSRETKASILQISAKTGQGLSALKMALETQLTERFGMSEQAGLTRSRHLQCVKQALENIQAAQNTLNRAPEIAGTELYSALHAIKELAGETDIEVVLDRVFSSFCIGK